MSFFLLSLLVYSALTTTIAMRVSATTEEWGFTLGHFVLAAAGNALLLHVARRRSLAFLGSPALAFLVMNQVYFTINALKYFSPILLYPQFDLSLTAQFWGSMAGGAVLIGCMLVLRYRGAPTAQSMQAWITRYRADLAAAAGGIRGRLGGLQAGPVEPGIRIGLHRDRLRRDRRTDSILRGLLPDPGERALRGLRAVAEHHLPGGQQEGDGRGDLLRLFSGLAPAVGARLFGGLSQGPRAAAAGGGALRAHLGAGQPRRRAERILQSCCSCLPALSLVGIQLTLLLGRINLPEDTGLRFAIAAINRRTDLTDFATAIVVNSGGSAFDPAIVPAAVVNAVPRFLFVGTEKVVPDVYSEILGSWAGRRTATGRCWQTTRTRSSARA